MKAYNLAEQALLKSVVGGQHWAVIDIDRVLINTTSWYHACRTPDLLIPHNKSAEFLKLNDKTFSKSSSTNTQEFRTKTLKLFNRNITPEYLSLVKNSCFAVDASVDKQYLYEAGNYIASRLLVYKDAYSYINYLQRRYGQKLHIVFLSAGYAPFMQGLIDNLLLTNRLPSINVHVFGSGITFNKGVGKETFHCYGLLKKRLVAAMLARHAHIVFAADDDPGNKSFLQLVEDHGGDTLAVQHVPNSKINKSWSDFAKNKISITAIEKDLKRIPSTYSLLQSEVIERQYPHVYKKFRRITQIGVMYMSNQEFQDALLNITDLISNPNERVTLRNTFSSLVYYKGNKVFLRGTAYYHWMPSYITLDTRTSFLKWRDQLSRSVQGLEILHKNKLLHRWPNMSINERLIVLCLLDYTKNSSIHALNTIYKSSLKDSPNFSKELLVIVDNLARDSTELYYGLLFDAVDNSLLKSLAKRLKNTRVIIAMSECLAERVGMRELDDPYKITSSVLTLLSQMKRNNSEYQCVVDFPCGGLELGLAYIAIRKILYGKENTRLIHCFYSSKIRLRDTNKTNKPISRDWIFEYVPKHNRQDLRKALVLKQKILLYDNNVTTFSTLADVKACFKATYGIEAHTVVTAVNYKNISKWLRGFKSEELHESWQETLTYQPVADYITAFNTWGTSQKSKYLESLYMAPIVKFNEIPIEPPEYKKHPIFKICRVHNAYDLRVAINGGANMIGIHAVYPDRSKYLKSQRSYLPLPEENKYSLDIPVSTYEGESIALMQRHIPDTVSQALLFEDKTSIKVIKAVISAYNLRRKNIYLQLQHRVDQQYVKTLRNNIESKLILSLGVFQNDFSEYFTQLDNILDGSSDFILLDLSKHQPDLIGKDATYQNLHDKERILEVVSGAMVGNRVPVIIADDTEISIMKNYLDILSAKNINIAGIDMQNIVEVPHQEQKYRKINDYGNEYQIRIRKSPDEAYMWSKYVHSSDFDKYFV